MDHGWRIIGTGLSFAVFGAGGLLMRVVVFPLLYVFVWRRERRVTVAREVIRITFRGFIGMMRVLGVLSYEIHGLEKLDRRGLLILANHPTLLDTVFLMAFVHNADCIVKGKLRNNPFTRGPVRAAGYICNDDGPGLIEDCIASLRGGSNVIIFPEGTRTPAPGLSQFKRGAANIAVRGRWNITPVVISCVPPTLGKGQKWWQVPVRRMHFRIDVRDDMVIDALMKGSDRDVLAARNVTEQLQTYFSKEHTRHAVG